MKLVRLELENIRSYKKEKIEFPEGRILFEGDIGCGKSTILMAIEFALFGLGNEKSESLLRIKSTKGKVVLEFETTEHKVIITRNLEKKKNAIIQTECRIDIDDTEYNLSVTELKAKVLKLLNFNEPANPKAKSIIYRYVIFTPQEEMKTILFISPQDRLNTLRKAMQLEDYKTAGIHGKNLAIRLEALVHNRDQIHSDLSQRELERKTYELSKNTKLQELESSKLEKKKVEELVKKLNNELIQTQAEKERLMLIENKAFNKKQLLEKEKEAIKQYERELGQHQKNIQMYNKEIQDNLSKIERLATVKPPSQRSQQDVEQDLGSLRKLEGDRNVFTSSLNQYTESLKKLEEELKEDARLSLNNLSLKIEENTKKLAAIEQDEEIKQNELFAAKSNISVIVSKIQELQEETKRLQDLPNQCPTCLQDITESKKIQLVTNLQNSIIELEKKKTFQENRSSELFQHKKDLTNQKKTLSILGSQLAVKRNLIEKFQQDTTRLKECSKKITEISSKIDQLMKTYANWQKSSSYSLEFLENLERQYRLYDKAQSELTNFQILVDKRRSDINSAQSQCQIVSDTLTKTHQNLPILERDIAEYTHQAEGLSKVRELVLGLQNKVDQTQLSLNQTIAKFSGIEQEIRDLTNNIEKSDHEISIFKNRLQQILKATEYQIWLNEFFLPTLPEIEARLMTKIHQDFNEKFQDWFSHLVPDPTKTVRIDEEFTPIIEQDGYEQNYSYLSGGEKTSIALAYRLALSFTVQQLTTDMSTDFLIFDEPTDGFSKEQLTKFRDLLEELPMKQIILVSHERELESLADKIFLIEKQNGISSIKAR